MSAPSKILLVAALFAAPLTMACQVPVFRYALERWEPDLYKIMINPGESGTLTTAEKKVAEFLKTTAANTDFPVNFTVEISEEIVDSKTATVAVFYPKKVQHLEQSPIWAAPATMENARKIFDSPVRRKIVTQLLAGKSAVWILLKGDVVEQNDEAAATLESASAEAKNHLQIPDAVLTRAAVESPDFSAARPIDPDNVLRSDVPLKIDFSTISLNRDDPAEAVFVQMLVNLEDDLHEYSGEAMVFPVFGRGRMLEPLIGRGIKTANALDYAGYLCGACSCQVKDQNPGTDLLIAANWQAALGEGTVVLDKVLPPLQGFGGVTADDAAPETPTVVPAVAPFPWMPLLIVVGGAILSVIIVSIILVRKNRAT